MKETWLNQYHGFSETYGLTQWCLDAFRPLLPTPTISPTCKRKGHDWTEDRVVMMAGAEMRACKRCARRGMVVIATQGDAP